MIMNQLNLNISIGRQKKEHNLPPHLGSIGTRVALRGGALVAGDGEAGRQQRRGQAQAEQRGHHGSLCSLCIPAVSLLYPCCVRLSRASQGGGVWMVSLALAAPPRRPGVNSSSESGGGQNWNLISALLTPSTDI